MFQSPFQNPLFIDIETVSCVGSFGDLSPSLQELWRKKAMRLGFEEPAEQEAAFFERAGIFAEFGKIITIAVGYIKSEGDGTQRLHVKGLTHDDEPVLLESFLSLLAKFRVPIQFCGHNIKEFDLPYLCRRLTLHGLPFPGCLQLQNKKPWEITHMDTLEMWKFGDRKAYTSLDLLAALFGIPSSKDQMDGSQVNAYYYKEHDLAKIKAYCIKDVIVTAQVYRKLRHLPLLPQEAIMISP